MAADVAAAASGIAGLILLDAWDIGATGGWIAKPENRRQWEAELAENLPPLAGTSGPALTREIEQGQRRFGLQARLRAYGDRPLLIIGAERGNGPGDEQRQQVSARAAGNHHVTAMLMPTDHSFSDHRIALADTVVRWLDTSTPAR